MPIVVKLYELGLVYGPDTQLTLHCADQGRALEEGAGEGLQNLGESSLATSDRIMEPDHGDVFLACALLGLHQSGCAIDADNWLRSTLVIQVSPKAFLEEGDTLKQPVTRGSSVPE